MSFTALAQMAMTDQQVLDYIQQGLSEGKSTREISTELAARGVTQDQARRAYDLFQAQNLGTNAPTQIIEETPRAHTTAISEAESGEMFQEIREDIREDNHVYGYSIFRGNAMNFNPSANLPTPKNYKLGPGDEVIIDVFGANQTTIRQHISPEGSIKVDVLGPLYLSGMTIDEANSYLKKRLSGIYGGIGHGTDLRLSLGQIRSIQISVLGEVGRPGTYSLSAFATVMHALYRANGVKDPGTLRNVKVNRGGVTVAEIDLYKTLVNGDVTSDVRLEDGDVILVQPYGSRVRIEGQVKRPMTYEMKKGETLADLISYAGGFATNASTGNITLIRQKGAKFSVFTVEESAYGRFELEDGDELEVKGLTSIVENRLEINGSVYIPGVYELSRDIHTVGQLIAKAGGLLPEAFTSRAVIQRIHDDKSAEVLSINLDDVLAGRDVELQNRDVLTISSKYELSEQGTMSISGYVTNPGSFTFAKNTTIEDLIVLAGGLREGASTAKVDVARRIKNADGTVAQKDVAELLSFTLKDGLIEDGTKGFVLEPYDEVVVHRSPEYAAQRHISINGEVNFEGVYPMTSREERLSDLVRKAGGVTQFAYLKGARLTRRMNEFELRQQREARESMAHNGETEVNDEMHETSYNISIQLDKALQYPGSDYDVILREDDHLDIPVLSNIVNVRGAVMLPNALTYNPSYSAGHYVKLCGGYQHRAFKRHSYIVYMNGEAHKMRSGTHVEPGSEIIIPSKGPAKEGVFAGIISATRDFTYTSALVASVIMNLIK